ncbi:MAG: SDR family oxidoreductase [Actinobacteria bacterium]|nr:SDR family oxidoreductase [Actinomycetota bacterium]
MPEQVRTAVVTGAGRGIGESISRRLAADGFSVIATDVDEATAAATGEAIGGVGRRLDVKDPDDVAAFAADVERCDVLVNNAGVWRFTPLLGTSPDDFRHVMETNVLGTLLCTQALAPIMARGGGGSIVNLTSLTARAITPFVGVYSASKAAIIALTIQTALELASDGIRANAVGPGFIPTPGTLDTYGADEETQRARGKIVPLGRYGTSAEVADAVAWFASHESRYVTGQVLFVDGGVSEATVPFLFQAQSR